jgi:hypothetical protein
LVAIRSGGDTVEVAGLPLAGDVGESAVRARDLPEPPARPRRQRAERFVAAVQEPRAHHERVAGDHVDETRPGAVRRLGDGDEQLPVLRLAVDDERVTLPDTERARTIASA